MIHNFKLAVITEKEEVITDPEGKKIKDFDLWTTPVLDNYIDEISENWEEQHEKFIKKRDKTYMPDSDLKLSEYFVLEQYKLPNWLLRLKVDTDTTSYLRKRDDIDSESIVALIGFAREYNEENENVYKDVILFQHFSKQQIIQPRSAFGLRKISVTAGYEPINRTDLIVFAKSITAVYYVLEEKLLFRAPTYLDKFLDIEKIYHRISKELISDILDHDILNCNDNLKIDTVNHSNKKIRKQFHKLKEADILDYIDLDRFKQYVDDVSTGDRRYSVDIIDNEIIYPDDEEKQLELLTLLNGDIQKDPTRRSGSERFFIIKDKTIRSR